VAAVRASLETASAATGFPASTSFVRAQIEDRTPRQRDSIPTVERFWRLLAGVVDELSST
jgi:hypothetical protein